MQVDENGAWILSRRDVEALSIGAIKTQNVASILLIMEDSLYIVLGCAP